MFCHTLLAMLKINFVDPSQLTVNDEVLGEAAFRDIQNKEFSFNHKEGTFDLTSKELPGKVVRLARKKMFIEHFDQK